MECNSAYSGSICTCRKNNKALGVYGKAKDLGGRDVLAKAKELFWYPSEVDVSIRPGWFYHEDQDSKVKSLKHLTDIYFQSVGYNSVLLLNIPPDTRGLINEADVNRLKEFRAYLDEAFADNKVVDGNRLWKAAQGEQKEYAIEDNSEINVIMLQEDISKGQRVEGLDVETLTDGQWKLVAQGTTVGYKRIFRFPALKAEKYVSLLLLQETKLIYVMCLRIMQNRLLMTLLVRNGIICHVTDGK